MTEEIKIYRENNKEKLKEYSLKYGILNRDKIKKQTAVFREQNRDRVNAMARKSYKKHTKNYIARSRAYQEKNKEKINEWARERASIRAKTEPLFKLKKILRGRNLDAFKFSGIKKNTKSEKLLGISFAEAKKHIERQFKKGMNWENHGRGEGKWEIDHKIPLASAKTEEEVVLLCHYTNLQPLWSKENNKKKAKILPTQMTLTI